MTGPVICWNLRTQAISFCCSSDRKSSRFSSSNVSRKKAKTSSGMLGLRFLAFSIASSTYLRSRSVICPGAVT
jgi:hypothetical protein